MGELLFYPSCLWTGSKLTNVAKQKGQNKGRRPGLNRKRLTRLVPLFLKWDKTDQEKKPIFCNAPGSLLQKGNQRDNVFVSIAGKIKQTAEEARPTWKPPCVDTFKQCFGWSRLGYCSSNSRGNFMRDYCKRSCNLCASIDQEYTSTSSYAKYSNHIDFSVLIRILHL